MPHISHLKSIPCPDTRQWGQYFYLIWTLCNQQCDQKHWYTYISHYWHMPWTNKSATLFTSAPLHVYHTLHIDSTLLHILIKKNKNATLIYHAIATCVCIKYAPEVPHICQMPKYSMCIYEGNMLTYVQHINSLVSTSWWAVLYTEDNDTNTDYDESQLHLLYWSLAYSAKKSGLYDSLQTHTSLPYPPQWNRQKSVLSK